MRYVGSDLTYIGSNWVRFAVCAVQDCSGQLKRYLYVQYVFRCSVCTYTVFVVGCNVGRGFNDIHGLRHVVPLGGSYSPNSRIPCAVESTRVGTNTTRPLELHCM